VARCSTGVDERAVLISIARCRTLRLVFNQVDPIRMQDESEEERME